MLSELARLGARLIIQRAVEEEFDSWLGRARYERRPERQRGLRNYDSGMRNGFRPRHVQTAEGELRIEIPQVREAAIPFVSKLFPKWHCKRLLRTDPLKALIIGGFVRGLSMRDVESLCEEAGLGKASKSSVSRVCAELHERFEAFCRRSLYDVNLVALFLDAIYLPVRPSGPKEGVICAWGITENGERALVSVRLGMREGKEDWLELGRDLTSRGLAAPRLVVADGAPGLISAVEEIWPRADRQHCAVHRLRNLLAKLPKSEQDRIRFNYWSALTDATSVKDAKQTKRPRIRQSRERRVEPRRAAVADRLGVVLWHERGCQAGGDGAAARVLAHHSSRAAQQAIQHCCSHRPSRRPIEPSNLFPDGRPAGASASRPLAPPISDCRSSVSRPKQVSVATAVRT